MSFQQQQTNEALQLWAEIQNSLPREFGPVSARALRLVRNCISKYQRANALRVVLADLLMFAEGDSVAEFAAAEALLDDVLINDPFFADAYLSFASLRSLQDRADDALRAAEVAVALRTSAETLLALADALLETGSDAKRPRLEKVSAEIRSHLEALQSQLRSVEARMAREM